MDIDPTVTAKRNTLTIKWLSMLANIPDHELAARLVEGEYAQMAGFPVHEVKGALDHITDLHSLEWIWARYGRDIVKTVSGGAYGFS